MINMEPFDLSFMTEEEKIGYRSAIDDIEDFIDKKLNYESIEKCCSKKLKEIKIKLSKIRKATFMK